MFKYIRYIIINKNDTDICLQEDNEQVIYIYLNAFHILLRK